MLLCFAVLGFTWATSSMREVGPGSPGSLQALLHDVGGLCHSCVELWLGCLHGMCLNKPCTVFSVLT